MSPSAVNPNGDRPASPPNDAWYGAPGAEILAHKLSRKYVGVCLKTPSVGLEIMQAFPRRRGWWVGAFNGRAEFYGTTPVRMVTTVGRRPSGDMVRQLFVNVGVRRFDTPGFLSAHDEQSTGVLGAERCPWVPEKKPSGRPSAYFLACLAVSRVKIGYAGNVSARRKALSRLSPFPLTLPGAMPGARKKEANYHRQFSELRRHGEWFSPEAGSVPFLYEHFGWQIVG